MRRSWVPYLIVCTLLTLYSPSPKAVAQGALEAPTTLSPTLAERLTPAEKAWLAENRIIRYTADPHWPPFSQQSADGRSTEGIDQRMFAEVVSRLGLQTQYVPVQGWTGAVRAHQEGAADLLLGTARTPDREQDFLFTDAYFEFPVVIVTRVEAPFLTTPDRLQEMRVAGPRGHVTTQAVSQLYPDIGIIETETAEDALKLVAAHKADATVGNLAVLGYLIGELDLSHLKVSGMMPENFALRYAVRRDWPELVSILNKTLDDVPTALRTEIVGTSLQPRLQEAAQRAAWRRRAGWIALGGVAFALVVGAWAIFLTRQVRERRRRETHLREEQLRLESTVSQRTEELRLKNEVLQRSEERFVMLFESLPDGSLVSTLDDGKIINVNSAFCHCTGYDREELIGKTSLELNLWARQADRDKLVQALSSNPKTVTLEADFRRREGEIIPVQFSCRIVEVEGRKCLVGVARELTELRKAEAHRTKLEEQLRQAQKMEALGRLTGGVAHDFNNLLQVIQGNVLMLQEAVTDEERELFLDGLMEASERAAGLTRQLLSFSRGLPLHREKLELHTLMQNELRMIQRVIPDSIEVHYECTTEPPFIAGDRTQLSQVIMNLCVNARDAMPSGGKLHVELSLAASDTETRLLSMDQRDQFARIRIRDTGTGMSEETRARIFEPFFTTKDQDRGTGLGLAVVYGIVEKHGGQILVETRLGVGTTFTILLPALEPTAVLA